MADRVQKGTMTRQQDFDTSLSKDSGSTLRTMTLFCLFATHLGSLLDRRLNQSPQNP